MANALDIRGITRREFLRLSSASVISLLTLGSNTFAYAQSLASEESVENLGRITANRIEMYDKPTFDGKSLRTLWQDLVFPITKTETGTDGPSHNPVWYNLNNEGYVYSGSVQPVRISRNEAVTTLPEKGALAEVTVPYTDAIWHPISRKKVAYRLYYSTTHWITGLLKDENDTLWYELLEDVDDLHYYANPAHLRIVNPEEIQPQSPSVPADEKRIEIHLDDQMVIAYEADKPVQMMRCSSGTKTWYGYLTPTGKFSTNHKRPSRHMVNNLLAAAYAFDLPGVPWISYFTIEGVAFHGAYWHNDFGRPRSHGCINLSPESARWLYCWTLPSVPFGEQVVEKPRGTSVVITL